MNPIQKKSIIGAILIILMVGVATFAYGFYRLGWESPSLQTVAMRLHLPVARVGSHTISYADYRVHLDAEARFLSGPIAAARGLSPAITSEVRTRSLDRAIRIAVVDEFAQQRGIVVTPLDIERVYDGLLAQAASSTTPQEFHTFLQDAFGWSENDFKRQVLRPAMLEEALRAKKLQVDKNPDAFEKELQERLQRPDVKRYLKT